MKFQYGKRRLIDLKNAIFKEKVNKIEWFWWHADRNLKCNKWWYVLYLWFIPTLHKFLQIREFFKVQLYIPVILIFISSAIEFLFILIILNFGVSFFIKYHITRTIRIDLFTICRRRQSSYRLKLFYFRWFIFNYEYTIVCY